MNNMLLLIGAPGSGKSTFVKEHGLESYTISPDYLRTLFITPQYDIEGNLYISQDKDQRIWSFIRDLIEERMRNGDFIVLDATNTRRKYTNVYVKLAEKYRYRLWGIRFDTPLEELLERNRNREPHKRVPEDIIRLHFERMKNLQLGSSIKMIEDLSEIPEEIKWFSTDYNKIWFIGDIHGIRDYLDKFTNDYYNSNDLFVFLGDYIDRGEDNVYVINKLIELSQNGNCMFLWGNHERWLWYWTTNQEELIRSKEFNKFTKSQLESVENVKEFKKQVRMWIRKFIPYVSFDLNGIKIFASHGGVPTLDFKYISTSQLINGVSNYSDIYEVINNFNEKYDDPYIQVCGHRNPYQYEIKNNRFYLLDTGIAAIGGGLRWMSIDRKGEIQYNEIPTKFINKRFVDDAADSLKLNEDNIIDYLTASDLVTQRTISNHIRSFNFKKDVFYGKKWNNITVKARGLFINIKTKEVVARSYDKFFNYEEIKENTLPYLKKNLVFPVTAYVKYNGYLGITGYDSETEKTYYFSKSAMGEFAKHFENMLNDEQKRVIEDFGRKGYSMVFEVLDPEWDPHIIREDKKVVLLDIIKRKIPEFEKLDFKEIVRLYDLFEVKEIFRVFKDFRELKIFLEETPYYFGDPSIGGQIEGVVFEDQNKYMFKYKFSYYKDWKVIRAILFKLRKGRYVERSNIFSPFVYEVINWLIKHPEYYDKNILEIQDLYYNEKSEKGE